tara:strand:+ start:742 stop:870 length:129 start_codon:yes stop_codon:yes gene_type:complete
MEVVDEFKKFLKKTREDEIKKNRNEKDDIITKQLKDLVGEEE